MVGFARSACGGCNGVNISCRPCKGTAVSGDWEQRSGAEGADLLRSVEELVVFVKTGHTNERK